jgi:peptide/nickel transport system substrate-binding protein/microcin C transport system substrate-binding protein
MFETLTVLSLDEVNTQYGLLAEKILLAPDFSSVTFKIRPQARFSNGDQVTAQDVKYSFDTLTSKKSSPRFRAYFSEIQQAVVVDERTIKFSFKRKGRDLSFVVGSLPVFSSKWGKLADGKTVPFDALRFEPPIATGPYVIEKANNGDDIVYRRNSNYWAQGLPVRRGMFNFERIVYKLYKDRDTQVAAIRAREYNFFAETQMRYWCCQYIGKHFDSGELIKEVVPHKNPPSMNGWVLNLRREKFQDPRVRQALIYTLDFDWINQKIFDDEFKRVESYFTGTPLAAKGLPTPDELKILEPFRHQLDPAVFGPAFIPPTTRPPHSLRSNLKKSIQLFAEAGWHNKDGILRNSKGEPFVIEIAGSRTQSPFMDPIYSNLSKVGVVVRKSIMDAATTRKRMNTFDYDFASIALRDARMPAAELWRNFNSQDAIRNGSENIAGLQSPVVDSLIQKLMDADTEHEQKIIGRALDRVLMHGHYIIPWRYLTNHYLIYNKRLKRPQTLPVYYGANEWAISTWWDGENMEKRNE